MEDITAKVDESEEKLEGLTEKETRDLLEITKRFVKSYSHKREGISDEAWLKETLQKELPGKTEEELSAMAKEIVDSVKEFDQNRMEINQACDHGTSREQWFCGKVSEASVGMSVIDYGNYLNRIDTAIAESNAQMMRAVLTKSGEINQNVNLHGFIAEQYHVNTFNMQAALEKAPFHAEVRVPEPGQPYGRNSVDVVIRDVRTGRTVHSYQAKYGKDARETIRLLQAGNYNNQRWLTPAEQAKAVSEAVGTKSVTGYIGGTDRVSTTSHPLSKEESLKLQRDVQEKGVLPTHDWNAYNTKELALNLGKNAGLVGINAALITTGFDMAAKVIQGEPIEAEEAVETAIKTGADAGLKAAAAGALKAGAEKGVIAIIPPGTPAGMIANIACLGIENAKILAKVASGEMKMSEALDKMGRTSTSMIYGLQWGTAGAAVGALMLSCIPIVGTLVGGVIGGMVSYMAGSKFGEAVYTGIKKVSQVARATAKSVWSGVKSVGSKISSGIKSLFGR